MITPENLKAFTNELEKMASHEKEAFLGAAASGLGRILATGAHTGVSALAKATAPTAHAMGPLTRAGSGMQSAKALINRGATATEGALSRGYIRGASALGSADKMNKAIGGAALGTAALGTGAKMLSNSNRAQTYGMAR